MGTWGILNFLLSLSGAEPNKTVKIFPLRGLKGQSLLKLKLKIFLSQ